MALLWREIHDSHMDATPSGADVPLPAGTSAVVVNGSAGNVVLQDRGGVNRTYASATITALGNVIPGNWSKVIDTGTTATGIIAWYRSF